MGLHLDELARDSRRPDVPPDEKHDINAAVFNDFVRELDYPAMEDVREAVDFVLHDQQVLAKAVRLDTYLERGQAARRRDGRGHTSILWINEYGVIQGQSGGAQSRWTEKPTPGGFALLTRAVHEIDIIKAIILTRQRQILAFCQPEQDESPLGIHLVRRDGEKLTKDDRKEIDRIEQILWNCGDEPDPRKRKRLRRDEICCFISKLVWDTLSADACPIETEMSQNGKQLSGWYSVPYETVRLCTEEGYEGDDEIFAVQIYDGVPRVAYTYNDLIYEVRNPRTDLRVNGYGFAEPEMIIRVLTAYLNSFNYNAAGLDRNSIPRGMLALFGEYERRELNAFKSEWNAMLYGAANRWRLPIMAIKDRKLGGVQFVPIDNNFNEMFFAKWMTLLVSIACAVYSIDPTEIHFDSFSSRNVSPLHGENVEERLAHSRDKGLIPLIAFIKRIYNTYLIPLLSPKYRLEFVGLHQEDEQRKHERLKLVATLDEIRKMDGRDPLGDPVMGNAPAGNPPLLGLYQQALMQQQQAQGPGGGVGAGAEEGGGMGAFAGLGGPAGGETGAARAGEEALTEKGTPRRGAAAPRAAGPGGPDLDKLMKARSTDDFLVVIERGAM